MCSLYLTKINLFSQGKALDKGLFLVSDSEKAQFKNKENVNIAVGKWASSCWKYAW